MTACLLAALLVTADPPPPPMAHTERQVHGWTVRVDDRLLAGPDADLGRRVLACVDAQLHGVSIALPADKVARLRKVPIWLDRTCGTLKPAQYHPSADWLAEHGYDRGLAKCVHVPDAAAFAAPRHQREQPWALLHELAHAYHDQVLGFEDAKILAAWRAAVAGGRYQSVLHMDGRDRPHYALTNQKEFFAEMTESYAGRNDFYPFNAAELKRHDPDVYRLMESVWGPPP